MAACAPLALLGTELTQLADRNAPGAGSRSSTTRPPMTIHPQLCRDGARPAPAAQYRPTLAFAGEARGFIPFEALKVPLASDGGRWTSSSRLVVPRRPPTLNAPAGRLAKGPAGRCHSHPAGLAPVRRPLPSPSGLAIVAG